MGIYSDYKPYSNILQDVHDAMLAKMKIKTLKKDALELQTILQEIKLASKDFQNLDKSIIGNEMYSQYYELIDKAHTIQMSTHGGRLKASTLFQREHSRKKLKTGADDIFEEDLAAILAAGNWMGTGEKGDIKTYLVGGQSASTRSSNYLNEEFKSITENLLKQLAEKEKKRVSTEVRKATGKIDVTGQNITLDFKYPIPFKVERLMTLMKDATISAKNYTSRIGHSLDSKELSNIGLHMGTTNLYKAVTGALSEIKMGHKQQTSFFFRGVNTILNNSHGNGDLTKQHFSHLRFIYEVRGSGLLGSDGLIMPVKFLIDNDPHSDAIFVKDTASLILENMEKSTNLFNTIIVTANKVESK